MCRLQPRKTNPTTSGDTVLSPHRKRHSSTGRVARHRRPYLPAFPPRNRREQTCCAKNSRGDSAGKSMTGRKCVASKNAAESLQTL